VNLFFLVLIAFLIIVQARLAADRISREMAREIAVSDAALADERHHTTAPAPLPSLRDTVR
jgi:hypothetical protein